MPFNGQSPGDFQPNSVVVVLPMMTAPAALRLATSGASSGTGSGEVVRLPRLVGNPARSNKSLTVTGTPSSGPIGRPDRQRIALSAAASRAFGFMTTKA